MSYRFWEPYRKNKKTESAVFSKHKMSLGRKSFSERGKEAEEEGAIEGYQHRLKGNDQFDECQGGENKENQEYGEKQVTSLNEMRMAFE